ncbi:MAG: 30S ribosomal protein S13 [Candidatus Pacearchaeota archaeon]|nr:30S ribosomal protein S13 [Candidatus Pacearchaeota archaeon]
MTEQTQSHRGKPEGKFEEKLVRILSKDIEGKLNVYVGLTKIKGISWSMANAICKLLKFDKKRKIGSLSKEEIDKINDFVKNPKMPMYMANRKVDIETGKDRHLIGNDLDLQKEFDIGRLRKIKSYRGLRHAVGLPVRGQRTKSHFRKNKKKGVGIKKKGKSTEGKE